MDTFRYVLGVMLVVLVPPAVVFWLVVHPLIRLWRRMGLGVTYGIVGCVCAALGVLLYRWRGTLLGEDLGTSWVLTLVGLGLYGISAWISLLTKRTLPNRTFVGVPEISPGPGTEELLTEGIYGRVRHPRYVSVVLGIAGYAMVVNYVGGYLLVLGSFAALFLVVLLEERELSLRFGAEYDAYRRRVPAFFPRSRREG